MAKTWKDHHFYDLPSDCAHYRFDYEIATTKIISLEDTNEAGNNAQNYFGMSITLCASY